MTYLPSLSDQLAVNIDSLTVLHNSTNDISISAGTVLPLGDSRSIHGNATYTVSNGVVTLPAGYYYLLRGGIGAHSNTTPTDFVSYRFYDVGASSYIGRRGWLTWQERPQLVAGDDYAIAVIDASTTAQNVDFRIVSKGSGTIELDPTSSSSNDFNYAGYCRVEVWRWA